MYCILEPQPPSARPGFTDSTESSDKNIPIFSYAKSRSQVSHQALRQYFNFVTYVYWLAGPTRRNEMYIKHGPGKLKCAYQVF